MTEVPPEKVRRIEKLRQKVESEPRVEAMVPVNAYF
jgi:hypothetical protein